MSNKKDDYMHDKGRQTKDKPEVEESVPPIEEDLKDKEECECTEETDTLSSEIAELKNKVEQTSKEKLLVMADFDNYRKRTLKEKADLIKSGGESCLKNLLPVIDDFERSLAAIEESNDIDAIKEGIDHIYNKFKSYLLQNGVSEIDTADADFNTEYHEAVTTYPVEEPEKKGKVIDCVQKGYKINDKVMRFAKVVVGE